MEELRDRVNKVKEMIAKDTGLEQEIAAHIGSTLQDLKDMDIPFDYEVLHQDEVYDAFRDMEVTSIASWLEDVEIDDLEYYYEYDEKLMDGTVTNSKLVLEEIELVLEKQFDKDDNKK